ncbi:hypothetical protein D9M68_989980 [compost metagenome]
MSERGDRDRSVGRAGEREWKERGISRDGDANSIQLFTRSRCYEMKRWCIENSIPVTADHFGVCQRIDASRKVLCCVVLCGPLGNTALGRS